jgi:hypothetical protein
MLLAASLARADDADAKTVARDAFVRGATLVRDAQWAEALAAFEQSERARSHALTSFNIGACHRAMGQYTRARKDFERSLGEHERSGGKELSPALAEETKKAAEEVRKIEARLDIELRPDDVAISIDGSPLERFGEEEGRAIFLADTLPTGPAAAAPKGRFSVLVDPGAHVIAVSRKGFADVVRSETLAPGSRRELRLELDRLPASIRVASSPEGGQVLVDGADVGLAPLTISRPAGRYHVVVKRSGFVPFETQAAIDPGQSIDVTAKLAEDKPSLTQKWWFWTGAGLLLAGAAATTYFVTRPAPERPAVDGGGLGWAVRAP